MWQLVTTLYVYGFIIYFLRAWRYFLTIAMGSKPNESVRFQPLSTIINSVVSAVNNCFFFFFNSHSKDFFFFTYIFSRRKYEYFFPRRRTMRVLWSGRRRKAEEEGCLRCQNTPTPFFPAGKKSRYGKICQPLSLLNAPQCSRASLFSTSVHWCVY